MKIGVILARFQPIHNGHIHLIKQACKENEEVIIFIGSANKLSARNPIPVELREKYVLEALKEHELEKQCTVKILDDLGEETDNGLEWGFYLYANIVKFAGQSNFTMYYSDGFEIITTWFPGYILRHHVSLSLLARGGVESGVSATLVRKYIQDEDVLKVKDSVPQVIYENRSTIKAFMSVQK